MSTSQLRQILKGLTYILFQVDATNKLLVYEGQNSAIYRTITHWCNVKKDLKQDENGVWMTHNGIIYDPSKDAFVEFAANNIQHLSIENIVSAVFPNIQLDGQMLGEGSLFNFIDEKYFSPEVIELLEKDGYISKSIKIPTNLVNFF